MTEVRLQPPRGPSYGAKTCRGGGSGHSEIQPSHMGAVPFPKDLIPGDGRYLVLRDF